MPLDVYVMPHGADLWDERKRHRVSLESDGYYWFLWPFFERLAEMIGQTIDLYDDADLSGEDIEQFADILQEARAQASLQPEQWEETIGHEIGSYLHPIDPPRPIRSQVLRERLLATIATLRSAAEEAAKSGERLVFVGD